ncbi:hypothetical protein [Chordicoccus furentiruminis]|uniref:hypothetical protein n=1 Tax=Chordicoccus furentiruminis TaxID=2709410 RepID=UPI0023A7C3A2|nr:hypothetical protein [Chordicoccus furentiruminis]
MSSGFMSKAGRAAPVLECLLLFSAFSELLTADSYLSPYLFVFAPAVLCLHFNQKSKTEDTGKQKWLIRIFSFLFAVMLTLANYPVWDGGRVRKIEASGTCVRAL